MGADNKHFQIETLKTSSNTESTDFGIIITFREKQIKK